MGAQWSVFLPLLDPRDDWWTLKVKNYDFWCLEYQPDSDNYMFNYRVLLQGIEFSDHLRYRFYGKSFSSRRLSRQGTTTRRLPLPPGSFSPSLNLNMLLSMLIRHLILSSLTNLIFPRVSHLGLLFYSHFAYYHSGRNEKGKKRIKFGVTKYSEWPAPNSDHPPSLTLRKPVKRKD